MRIKKFKVLDAIKWNDVFASGIEEKITRKGEEFVTSHIFNYRIIGIDDRVKTPSYIFLRIDKKGVYIEDTQYNGGNRKRIYIRVPHRFKKQLKSIIKSL